ncbi:MAG: TolC family protein [Pseudomonadota bacterium]
MFCEKPDQKPSPDPGIEGEAIVRLGDFLFDDPTEPEKKRIQMVLKEVLTKDSIKKKMGRLEDKEVVFLSERDAAIRALRKNLVIMVEEKESEMAKEALMEAEAVFDPVLSFSFSHSESDSNNRSKNVPIQTKKFLPGMPLRIPKAPGKEEAQIIELGWRNQEDGDEVIREIFASKEPEKGPLKSYQGSLAISQLLPWGPELHISTATLHQEVFYDNDGHSYHAPFTSSLKLGLSTPLPGTKGFGPYAERDVSIKLAEKRNEWGFWSVKSTINAILSQVHDDYWNVVRAFESLFVAAEKRKIIEKQSALCKRLFDDRLATVYDLHQIEAEYAATLVQEMAALNGLISRSNGLAALIEDDPSRLEALLYLPYKYQALLEEKPRSDPGNELETARGHRPELQMAKMDLEQTRISSQFSENQLGPDVRLSTGLTFNQDGSVYGYKTPWDSLENVIHPDIRDRTFSLTYAYPVGNRALKALHRESEERGKNSRLSLRAVENRVMREVKDAFSMVETSCARISAAGESLDFARIAYDKVRHRREMGESNQFEWILNMQRLMEARLALLLAQVDHRIALAGLTAAEGTIEKRYVNRLTQNPCDRLRINRLKEDDVLVFFHPEADASAHRDHPGSRPVSGVEIPGQQP